MKEEEPLTLVLLLRPSRLYSDLAPILLVCM